MSRSDVTAAVTVSEALSRELDDDYVGLWVVPWHLRRELSSVSDTEIRELAEAIVRALVARDVVLGDIDGETGEFSPWDSVDPVGVAMTRWAGLGRDPNIGEVAWLARTD